MSKTEFNSSEAKVQYPNAMTCLSSDDEREKNCIQVIQAEFNQIYYKTFNRSLEFRLIYSYSDVSYSNRFVELRNRKLIPLVVWIGSPVTLQ